MKITIRQEDFDEAEADRDGVLNDYGRQGFYVQLGCYVSIEFEDEQDAVRLARMILKRMGET